MTAILRISSTKIASFLHGLATSRSHAASVQHDLITHSSPLLVPPISSPCLDANGGNDFPAIGSLD